jgi:hypothetical protein
VILRYLLLPGEHLLPLAEDLAAFGLLRLDLLLQPLGFFQVFLCLLVLPFS